MSVWPYARWLIGWCLQAMIVHFECATFSQWTLVMEAATVAAGDVVRPYFFTFAFVINLLYVNVLCSFTIHCFMHEYVLLKKQLRDDATLRDRESQGEGVATTAAAPELPTPGTSSASLARSQTMPAKRLLVQCCWRRRCCKNALCFVWSHTVMLAAACLQQNVRRRRSVCLSCRAGGTAQRPSPPQGATLQSMGGGRVRPWDGTFGDGSGKRAVHTTRTSAVTRNLSSTVASTRCWKGW